jgi:hypothetical protein
MSIDKTKITTQDELGEPAPMDEADKRAEKEMKELDRAAKRDVAEGLGTPTPPSRNEPKSDE